MIIDAKNMHFQDLNEEIRNCADAEITIDNCIGQRYIGSGESGRNIIINGTPGNALGAYLNGSKITVNGNVQDAVGDTMNDGAIIVYGSSGDATGYAMRGGEIYIKENVGYRAGIHMKSYKDKSPVIVIGGSAGSFLGEYLAGGTIIVLGLNSDGWPVSNFCGTGMHGGKIYIRSKTMQKNLPKQVMLRKAEDSDIMEIKKYIETYCDNFNADIDEIMNETFYVLTANSKNPYKQLYVHN